jgi:hypothetical protein
MKVRKRMIGVSSMHVNQPLRRKMMYGILIVGIVII